MARREPRRPTYEGTETIPWGEVSKDFATFLKAYYARTGTATPDDPPSSTEELNDTQKSWMAAHSTNGEQDADTFEDLLVLPVVNPMTGKLNRGAIRAAKAYASRTEGINVSATMEMLDSLAKEFEKSQDILSKNNDLDYQIKDIDSRKGIVEIYVNAFNNEDSDGDISEQGSFSKTIQENQKRIKHFLNHNWTQLIGVPIEMKEDEKGLLVRSQLNMNKQIGKDVFEDYKLYSEHGKTLEHSIGVEAVKRDDSNPKVVKEWKLYEYSTLTFLGANPETPLVNLKNVDTDLLELMLNKGNYSDTRFQKLENLLNKTNALLNEPPCGTHKVSEPLLSKLKETQKLLTNG